MQIWRSELSETRRCVGEVGGSLLAARLRFKQIVGASVSRGRWKSNGPIFFRRALGLRSGLDARRAWTRRNPALDPYVGAFAAGGTRLRIDHVFDAVQVR